MSGTKTRTTQVKLYGGPLDGRVVELPASADIYHVGPFWTYEFAGRDGREVRFAIRPSRRRDRKFNHWYVGKFGRHPGVEAAMSRGTPIRTQPAAKLTKAGKAARARAAA